MPAPAPPPPPDLSDPAHAIDTLRAAAQLHLDDPRRRGATVHLPDTGRLFITGDLHDHALNLQRILQRADLDRAPNRHLILHEVIHGPNRVNGMDLSLRTLLHTAHLKTHYPHQLITLQSNHELAQRLGEAISKDGESVVDAFDDGLEFLFPSDADEVRDALSDYIASLPLAVKTANRLLVAHSLPAPKRIETFDPAVLDRVPTEDDLQHGSAYDLVWGRYQNTKILGELADAWSVDQFVLGHQPAEMGYLEIADRALVLASDHGHGVLLPIDLTKPLPDRDGLIELLIPLAAIRVSVSGQ
ncbi:MAG: hypothetical protein AAF750_02065 [Planctomycetota bacterium]